MTEETTRNARRAAERHAIPAELTGTAMKRGSRESRDLSKPQADFTLAVFALLVAGFALLATFNAWARRKNLNP